MEPLSNYAHPYITNYNLPSWTVISKYEALNLSLGFRGLGLRVSRSHFVMDQQVAMCNLVLFLYRLQISYVCLTLAEIPAASVYDVVFSRHEHNDPILREGYQASFTGEFGTLL